MSLLNNFHQFKYGRNGVYLKQLRALPCHLSLFVIHEFTLSICVLSLCASHSLHMSVPEEKAKRHPCALWVQVQDCAGSRDKGEVFTI